MKRNTVVGACLLLGLTFTSGLCLVQQRKISRLEASLAENMEPSKQKSAKRAGQMAPAQGSPSASAATPPQPPTAAVSSAPEKQSAATARLNTLRTTGGGGSGSPVLRLGSDSEGLGGAGGGESAGGPGISGLVDNLGGPESRTTNGHVHWDHTQATGAPDTPEAGDRPTAWAPRSPKSGEQWLQLGYEKPVEMKEINIHESHSSGAISKVTALMPNGTEKTLWTGNAAPGAANEILETAVPVPRGITSSQIKIYVDTNRVGSWPEIDAVELVGTNGSRQWASTSSASSSYSEVYTKPGGPQSTVEYESTARTESTKLTRRGGN